jgi:hypothetical protein
MEENLGFRAQKGARATPDARVGVLVTALSALASGCLRAPDRYAQSSLDVRVDPPDRKSGV